MNEYKSRLLRLIVLRFFVTSFVLGAAALALPSQAPLSQFLLPFFLIISVLTGIYLLIWQYTEVFRQLYLIQFATDFLLLSTLLYFSGGISSVFTPIYVLIIVYASLFEGRYGGVLALTLSIISYVSIVHMGYLGLIPGADEVTTYQNVAYRISVNLLAFVSVALLGIYLSERLRSARQELGAAKVLQENIIDSIRSGLLTLDLDTRVTFFNRVGAEIIGYEQEELLGKPVIDIFPEAVLDEIRNSDFQSSSKALRVECWIKTSDGNPIYLGMGCSPLLSQEEDRIGYVLSFQDLTEIKEREQDFQFKEKMAAVGEMAAGLAHELRNPLGSLSGSIQLLRSELDLLPDQAKLFDIILRESERLNRTVGDFLTYAARPSASLQPIDLRSLVDDTVQLFRNSPELDRLHHHIEVQTGTQEIGCIGNPDQLRQVVWNILQNGIRAMPDGGRLVVQIGREDSRVLVGFRDTGIGMSEAEKKKLFQPFHRGFQKGSGLGMAIVYQIIQQHSGEIRVQSAPGAGTSVEILLPGSPNR